MSAPPQHATLVANTPTTIVLDNSCERIEVVNVSGTARVYFTTDGSAPGIAQKGSHVVVDALGAALEVDVSDQKADTVTLISSGTPMVSVRGIG